MASLFGNATTRGEAIVSNTRATLVDLTFSGRSSYVAFESNDEQDRRRQERLDAAFEVLNDVLIETYDLLR
jgi:hypothetical protein